jgi:TPR repeat protein
MTTSLKRYFEQSGLAASLHKEECIYVHPNIPASKIKGAKASYVHSYVQSDEILVLIDESVFGNAKAGLVLTEDAIYLKEAFKEQQAFLIYDIKTITAKRKIIGAGIFVNGKEIIDFSAPKKSGIVLFANAVSEFINLSEAKPKTQAKPQVTFSEVSNEIWQQALKIEIQDAPALSDLGVISGIEKGVDQDQVDVVEWSLSAEQGDTDLGSLAGQGCYSGEDSLQDQLEVMAWYRESAEQSQRDAQLVLGRSHNLEESLTQDNDNVADIKRHLKVAEQRHATAQHFISSSENQRINKINLCTSVLPDLLKRQQNIEVMRISTEQVDGVIIGTGEADFTKGNVEYEFTHKDKTFQLVDVPGIEGDESKYEILVEEAVAKAHLIFYVNGTNKKPEAETAKKIKKYLNQDAVVYAICNIRGKADSYEFDEDRVELEETHKDAAATRDQTVAVLAEILGQDLLLGAQCVQGLMAFCAVAYNEKNLSTISPNRAIDLNKAQTSYLLDFKDKSTMKHFSQINEVEGVIIKKFSTFKEDIVASNKRKVVRRIDEAIIELTEFKLEQDKITTEIKVEMDSCTQLIRGRFQNFSTSLSNKRMQAMNSFFTSITEGANAIIRENFDDKSYIENRINSLISQQQNDFSKEVEQIHHSEMSELTNNINQAIKRLEEDMKNVNFKNNLANASKHSISLQSAIDAIDLNLKDLGGALFNIGSYALSGFGLGTVIPGLGNIAGAVIGAIGGLIVAVFKWLQSKDTKIREAQTKARQSIDSSRRDFQKTFDSETQTIIKDINTSIQQSVFHGLDSEYQKMVDISVVLNSQIQTISNFKETVIRKQYGTV